MNERMPRSSDIENLLVEQMRSDIARPRWWMTARGRIAIAGGALAVAGASVAAVSFLQPEPITDTVIVHCLERAQLNPDGSLPGAAVSLAAPEGVLPLRDAESVCRQMWASGSFQADALDASPSPGRVPETFTTCVTDSGAAAVLPGAASCSSVGMAPYRK